MTTGLAPVTPIHRPRDTRPSRAQIEPAALALLARHSAQILATARRYSATPEDAEDAYQRGVEILLTKAPTTRESDLLPWLKTVVKHEAFAVRRANGRALPVEQPHGDACVWSEDQAEHHERLRMGAEALAGLKPQEIRCLLLRAEGLSYNEICAATGWTYTKVNRCLTEGRRAFARRLAVIDSGAECERLAPLLSRLADGEADASDMQRLRPHLRNCLACRATLKSYRAAPARAAALVPPVIAAATLPGGGVLARLADLFGLASANKIAAVAASAAALAGGGAATYGTLDAQEPRPAAAVRSQAAAAAPAAARRAAEPARAAAARSAVEPARATAARSAAEPAREPTAPGRASAPRRTTPRPAPEPAASRPSPASWPSPSPAAQTSPTRGPAPPVPGERPVSDPAEFGP